MVVMPSTWASASSMISTTSASMDSGAAPSQFTCTVMLGKSTSGRWLMPMRRGGHGAEHDRGGHDHPGQDRPPDADVGEAHGASFLGSGVRLGPGRTLALHLDRGAVAQGLGAADHHDLPGLDAGSHLDRAVGGAHAQGQDALAGDVVLDHEGHEPAFGRPHRGRRQHRRLPRRLPPGSPPRRRRPGRRFSLALPSTSAVITTMREVVSAAWATWVMRAS